MLERYVFDGKAAATIQDSLSSEEYNLICDIQTLEIAPKYGKIELPVPLSLENLQKLKLSHCHENLSEMIARETLQKLRRLTISHSPGVLRDIDIRNLDSLNISNQLVENESLILISRQKSLKHLALFNMNVTDSVILSLNCSNTLESLFLYRTEINFEHEELKQIVFPKVTSLDVCETGVSSVSVQNIHSLFPQLGRLLAEKTLLTEADARKIAKWDSLKILSTGHASVDFDHHNQTFWP